MLPLTGGETGTASLAAEPLTEIEAAGLAAVFKALADPVRLRLFSLVASHNGDEASVLDLAAHFDVTQPTISHHLKVLREAGLLDPERRGTSIYYRARPEAMAQLSALLAPGVVA